MPTLTHRRQILPRQVIKAMGSAADRVISDALLRGSDAMLSPPRSEVGFVAAVTGSTKGIAAAWQPMCAGSGLSLELTGVFCHGAPIVRFADTRGRLKRCELAD